MPTTDPATREALDAVHGLHKPMAETLDRAVDVLVAKGHDRAKAIAFVASKLVTELADVLADRAVQERTGPESRTFERLFDVDDATTHFQQALDHGLEMAAKKIEADGFPPADAVVLAGSRALDAVSDLLTKAAR